MALAVGGRGFGWAALVRARARRGAAAHVAHAWQVYVVLLQYGRRRKKAGSKGAAADESAAADALRLAGEYCTLISARFPDSVRVRRLEAMMWEAKDEFELAMADYDEILKDDPTNLFALKRQVALAPTAPAIQYQPLSRSHSALATQLRPHSANHSTPATQLRPLSPSHTAPTTKLRQQSSDRIPPATQLPTRTGGAPPLARQVR